MKQPPARQRETPAFDRVRTLGLALPDVTLTTKYDGSPVLKVRGAFLAGLATHPSAEPDTLVVRANFEERETLVQDAPDTYYFTDHYRRYPVVLVRLSRVRSDALRDLLTVSRRMTVAKARVRRPVERTQPAGSRASRAAVAFLTPNLRPNTIGRCKRLQSSRPR